MDAIDYAYEWLEATASIRKKVNADKDSELIAAFVAGYEAAQQGAQENQPPYFDWNCPVCGMSFPSTVPNCPNCRQSP